MKNRMLDQLDLETLAVKWKEADRRQAFWTEHRDELRSTYPNLFVAARNGSVVAVAPDLTQLIRMVQAAGISLQDVWLRYIDADDMAVVA